MARKRKVVVEAADDPFAEPAPQNALDIVPDALLEVVSGLKGWRPAADVLVSVRSVPTCLLGMDRALGIGGFPLGRMYVVHGPSGCGKTSLELAIIRSFLERGHLAALVDSEHSTPIDWADDMLRQYARHPLFIGQRPKTYEETIDAVDEVLKKVPAMKKVRPGIGAVIVVDSINKLTPEHELASFKRLGADAADKGMGRQRANMNQVWIDHLTPLLGSLDVSIVFIAQERTKKDASADDVKYGNDWEIKGGRGLFFDSSLAMRVTRAGYIKRGDGAGEEKGERDEDARSKEPVVGTRHRVRVHKSKVEWLTRSEDFFFHVTNGKDGKPAGFDFGRDMLEHGVSTGVLERSGGWIRWGGRKWHGVERFVEDVAANGEWIVDVDAEIRERIKEGL